MQLHCQSAGARSVDCRQRASPALWFQLWLSADVGDSAAASSSLLPSSRAGGTSLLCWSARGCLTHVFLTDHLAALCGRCARFDGASSLAVGCLEARAGTRPRNFRALNRGRGQGDAGPQELLQLHGAGAATLRRTTERTQHQRKGVTSQHLRQNARDAFEPHLYPTPTRRTALGTIVAAVPSITAVATQSGHLGSAPTACVTHPE